MNSYDDTELWQTRVHTNSLTLKQIRMNTKLIQ